MPKRRASKAVSARICASNRPHFSFQRRNRIHLDVFEPVGTFRFAASHQSLNTLCPDKPPHHTHFEEFDPCVRTAFATCLFASFLASAAALLPLPLPPSSPMTDFGRSPSSPNRQLRCATTSTVTVTEGKISAAAPPFPAALARGGLVRSLDQWCICERSTQWQLRIGEMEWGISWCTVQRSMGSIPSVRPEARPLKLFADTRRLTLAAVAFFMASVAASTSHAQSGPFAGMAGNWSGGGTITLDDGSNERIRCRATYQVAGANMDDEPHLRQRRLQVQSRRPMSSTRAARFPAAGAKPAAISPAPFRAAAAAAISRSSPARAGFNANISLRTAGNKQSVSISADSQFRGANISLSK